jgi:hypothetical protein
MPGGCYPATINCVQEPTRITIEFDTTDPVSGRVLGDGGMTDSFAGWLDLLTLLQSVNTEYGGKAERVE